MAAQVKMGFSGPLFRIAQDAAEKSVAREHSSFVAILFSAFALEAWLNELLDTVQGDDPYWSPKEVKPLAGFAAELDSRGASSELKVQLIATALSGRPLERGRNPYQDFALLMQIRNTLVHARPEYLELRTEGPRSHHRILEALRERGVVELERKGVIHPLYGTLGMLSVGRWAYQTAVSVAEAIAEMLPLSGLRTSSEFAFGKLPPELQDELPDLRG